MLIFGNVSSPSLWRAVNVWVLCIALFVAASTASAQEAEAPPLDAAQVAVAFNQADRWLRANDIPAKADASLTARDVLGALITLRWQGHVVGRGLADANELGDGDATDVLELTRLAIGRADSDFVTNLTNRVRTQEAADALEESIALMRATITIDLQLAHTPRVIDLPADVPADQIYRTYAPGFHGLRLTLHQPDVEPVHADVWPGTVIASNIQPSSQLVQLLSQLHQDLKLLPSLGRPGLTELRLERFEVIQLAQPSLNLPVTQLVRGNVILPRNAIDQRTLDAMAQRMVDNLLVRSRDDGRLAGTFMPTANQYDPPVADVVDAALAVYALSQWHALNEHTDAQRAALVREALNKAVEQMMATLGDVDAPSRPAVLALMALTLADSPSIHERDKALQQVTDELLTLRDDEDGTFRGQPDQPTNLTTQAVIALAMMRLDADAAVRRYRLIARELIDHAWRNSDMTNVVGSLPWLYRAERLLAAAQSPDKQFMPMYPAELDNALNLLLAVQVTDEPHAGPSDVLGGFDFNAGDRLAPPNPDWRSAYALHALADAMTDAQLTPADRIKLTGRAALAARFIAQLMFDESNSYYVRSAADTRGGVRSRLWDNQLGVTPTAASLLAVTRLQAALRELDARR